MTQPVTLPPCLSEHLCYSNLVLPLPRPVVLIVWQRRAAGRDLPLHNHPLANRAVQLPAKGQGWQRRPHPHIPATTVISRFPRQPRLPIVVLTCPRPYFRHSETHPLYRDLANRIHVPGTPAPFARVPGTLRCRQSPWHQPLKMPATGPYKLQR